MLIYKITGHSVELSVYIAELEIQSIIAENAYNTLHKQHLYTQDKRKENSCAPIKVIADCALFLNSAAMISKILGLTKSFNNNRAQQLRALMELDMSKISNLASVDIRNSMEHIDDRFDLLIKENPSSLVLWDLSQRESTEEHVLRKFNPKKFVICFLGRNIESQEMHLKAAYSEIQYVKSCLDIAREELKYPSSQ